MRSGWLTRSQADIPARDDWLGARERRALAALHVPKRRDDWRLGRWTAKAALAAWLGVPPGRIEVLAAEDGAPEAWLDGVRAPVTLSLSHRAGVSVAVVAGQPAVVGCDIELLEPRSPAFVGDWLAPEEQALAADDPTLVANLVWTAKEAAAKVRREGLRLDVRSAVTRLGDGPAVGGWRPLSVDWVREARAPTRGWWRSEDGFVLTVAAAPDAPAPERL
jgi:4'-phosphopantetheinyl transferase